MFTDLCVSIIDCNSNVNPWKHYHDANCIEAMLKMILMREMMTSMIKKMITTMIAKVIKGMIAIMIMAPITMINDDQKR